MPVEDGFLGPEDQGSMAFKLNRAAEAPRQELPVDEAAREENIEAQPEGQPAGEPVGEEPAGTEGAEGVSPEPPKFKFQTIEDYDKAYNEAVKRMTAATTETAEERKARETAERELSELREKEAARQAELSKPDRAAAIAAALEKIQGIPTRDPDSGELVYPPDYNSQVAAAWAEATADPDRIAEEVLRRTEEKEAKRRAEREEQDRLAREATEAERITADAERMATESFGLDMNPGSTDHRLFYSFVQELKQNPDHEILSKPFEEQVKWASEGVRKLLGQKIEMTDAERQAARRNQQRNAVLERGVTRNAPPEPTRQRTMGEILGQPLP